MPPDTRLPSVTRMRPGDHCCGVYRTEDEHRALMVDFIRQGVERREKMFYIVDVHTAAGLRATLESGGIDVDRIEKEGQFTILTARESYLLGGEFDPDKMIQLLGSETDKAVKAGYAALRVTGEMTWALAGEPGSERLIEYESKLNDFFPGRPCYAICQYQRGRFDPEVLLDVLHTHPKVMLGIEDYDNSCRYFVPPRAFLGADRQGAMLDRWLENLAGHG